MLYMMLGLRPDDSLYTATSDPDSDSEEDENNAPQLPDVPIPNADPPPLVTVEESRRKKCSVCGKDLHYKLIGEHQKGNKKTIQNSHAVS